MECDADDSEAQEDSLYIDAGMLATRLLQAHRLCTPIGSKHCQFPGVRSDSSALQVCAIELTIRGHSTITEQAWLLTHRDAPGG